MIDMEFSFDVLADESSETFVALRDGFIGGHLVGLAAANGDIEVAGTHVFAFNACIVKFEYKEPLREAAVYSVTAKPTYSANEPTEYVVDASSRRRRGLCLDAGPRRRREVHRPDGHPVRGRHGRRQRQARPEARRQGERPYDGHGQGPDERL
jgi:hypothetical protein